MDISEAEKLVAKSALAPNTKRELLQKIKGDLETQINIFNAERHQVEAKIYVHEFREKWQDNISGPEDFRPANASRLHKALTDFQYLHDREDEADRFLKEALFGVQVFLVQRDWFLLMKDADGVLGDDEYKLPFDSVAFEFCFEETWMIYLIHNGRFMDFIQTPYGWGASGPSKWSYAPDSFVGAQVRAMCIFLETELAETTVTRAPHKLNLKRERRGQIKIYDHHVVKLANRKHYTSIGEARSERRSPRLHFRRGHWRHYEGHKTWIKWQIVGNPDLGFVDKTYSA